MEKTKVLVVGGDYNIERMFREKGWAVVRDLQKADLVQFTGGSDVSPELYGQDNVASWCSPERDAREKNLYKQALTEGKAMAGICRGGQFLNVMAGGKMYQHVEGHGRTHELTDLETNKSIKVTSTHHQMMVEAKDAEIVAVANLGEYKMTEPFGDTEVLPEHDTEVVFYNRGVSPLLCFQPHPEYGLASCRDYYFSLLDRYMGL